MSDFLLENVHLVEEKDEDRPREKLGGAYRFPEYEGILQTVDTGVFDKSLVKTRDWCEKYDRIDLIKIR